MEVVVKKTNEISDDEIKAIYRLFETVFHRHRDVAFFKEEFGNTPKGYSYHAIWYNDKKEVIGHNVYMPFLYQKDNEKFWLALSIDAMVHPDYRGKGGYRKLLQACGEAAREDGCKLRIGFPNDNSYPIQKNGFKFNEIGSLTTYCNPIRLGGISPKLKIFNFMSIISSFLITIFSYCSLPFKKVYIHKYMKDRDSYDRCRYKWFGGDYKIIEKEDFKFVYRKSDFKGKEALFLMDVYPLSKANFDKACRYIYFHEFATAPILIYVGNLKFTPFSLIRIPKKFEPKHFHFLGKVYDPEFLKEDVLDIDNWDINLSNYDLL